MIPFRSTGDVRSWGGVVHGQHRLASPFWADEVPDLLDAARREGISVIAAGLGRSYGDSGLNPGGGMIDMTGLDRAVAFDPATRILSAEAGMSLADVLRLMLPRGYFLPVTPGTRFVTIGGAIANDVHGKNHHRNGTIGRWVRRLTVLRSDGHHLSLGPDDPSGLFAATIGGLGLTGIITHADIELVPLAGAMIACESIPFGDVGEFFAIARESEATHEHTVAWVDCLAGGRALGRGIFLRGNHAGAQTAAAPAHEAGLSVPAPLPQFILNGRSVAAFNTLYFRLKGRQRSALVPLAAFFYPLDRVRRWNLVYGRRGLYQYQAVVPPDAQEGATREMLEVISASGQGSFLAVLKTFGAVASPGLLSFPSEGTTLALDFPNRGDETLALLARLDDIVLRAGGRLYPAKDGRMPANLFQAGYPRLEEFARHVDPQLSSQFWRRVRHG